MHVESLDRQDEVRAVLERQQIVVVCSADDNYAMPLAVTLRSAIDNLKDNCKILLYVIDGGIQAINKQKILKSLDLEKCEVEFLQIPKSVAIEEIEAINKTLGPDGQTISKYLSIATFFRILIPDLLPINIDKAIYLDCDLVINGDLSELWQHELGDNYILAAQDTWIRNVSAPNGLLNYQELGIAADAKYFNAGVLVINIKQWRADEFCTKAMNYLRENKQYVRWHDQDVLNPLLAGKWQQLDPKWNFNSTSFYDYDSSSYLDWQDEESLFPKDIYNNLITNPAIVHYASAKKPWTSRHCPRKEDFFKYVDLTEWSGWRLTPWQRLQRRLASEFQTAIAKLGWHRS